MIRRTYGLPELSPLTEAISSGEDKDEVTGRLPGGEAQVLMVVTDELCSTLLIFTLKLTSSVE